MCERKNSSMEITWQKEKKKQYRVLLSLSLVFVSNLHCYTRPADKINQLIIKKYFISHLQRGDIY